MRILVITSCTGEKAVTHQRQLTLQDFRMGPAHVRRREEEVRNLMRPAEDLYSGQQHVRLMRGIRAIRQLGDEKLTVDLYILSAGYGLVKSGQSLAPYAATFQGMRKKELRVWADALRIPVTMRRVLAEPYDIALVLLGDPYLEACALDDEVKLGGPAVLFCGTRALERLPSLPRLRSLAITNKEARRFSCGLVALKGELGRRLLGLIAEDRSAAKRLTKPELDVLSEVASAAQVASPGRARAAPNPAVDYVIQIPKSWWGKPHRAKLRYFIPEWDDLVDPDYNFDTDTHSGGSGDWSNEVYAHQLYPEPNYDGILVSKVVAEKSKKKTERINALGVHRYLRVPREFPIMGDCGAFGYIKEAVPPYSTEEILDYYTRLGFDYGVSVDHLIVTATEHQKTERYQLTIQNAEDFLVEHRKRGLSWEPVGAVQGWDPRSYAEAARQYAAMGYRYIGLGGLVRSSTKDILVVLSEVHQVIPASVAVHLFGLARVRALQAFAELGVRSVDSASFLRRAWMGTGQNYLTMDGETYAAIRIPEAGKSFRAKRMVSEGRAASESVEQMASRCLEIVRGFDAGVRSVDETLAAVLEYDRLITPGRPDNVALLRCALEERPWRRCECGICRRHGVEVMIFRGNNRNRRRGFHNTYVFYRLVQRALAGEDVAPGKDPETQLDDQLNLGVGAP